MRLKREFFLGFVVWLAFTSLGFAQRLVLQSPGRVYAAVQRDESAFLILGKDSNAVERYSIDGKLIQSHFTNRTPPLAVWATMDFTTDNLGNIHALVLSAPPNTSRAYVMKFMDARSPTIITLDKAIEAWGIEVDDVGNYYLLGVETPARQKVATGNLDAADFKLIHKFSPEGSFLASFFQPKPSGKVSREEYTRFTHCLLDGNNFVAVTSNELWFLYTDKRAGVQSPFEWQRSLYRILAEGAVSEIKPKPPETGYELMAIHRYDSSALFEWMSTRQLTNRIFTRLDGSVQSKVDLPGNVLSVKGQTALVSTLHRDVGYKITSWQLK